MSKQQNNTKKGAAAIYIVIFTATLLGIVTLSFVRLMLAESMRTTNYSLSQSAYNSALAGIEDAKVVLLRYQNCVNSGSTFASGVECDDYVDAFDSLNTATNAEDCDLVRNLLGYDTDYNKQNHETLIQTNTSDTISSAGAAFDQAYTCVKINQKSSNYLTTLTENYPTKIVPVRTGNSDDPDDEDNVNQVNRIVISWFNRKNVDKVSLDGALDTTSYRNPQYGQKITSSNFNSFIAFSDDNANPYYNTFGDPNNPSTRPIAPPTIQMTLIQTAEAFKLSQFYSNNGNATNRGTLTLRPVNKAATTDTLSPTHISKTSGGLNALAASANKSQNSPIDVICDTQNEELEYSCIADIVLPRPREGYSYTRKTKVKVYKRKFTGNHVLYGRDVQYEVCTNIDEKTGRCDRYTTMTDSVDPGVELSGDGVKITNEGALYNFKVRVCTGFNGDGSCSDWTNLSSSDLENPQGKSVQVVRVTSRSSVGSGRYRYYYRYCRALMGTECRRWSSNTSYVGTSEPRDVSAVISDIDAEHNYSYKYCRGINSASGACSTWSGTVYYSGAEITNSARNGIVEFRGIGYRNIYSHEYRPCAGNYDDGRCYGWSSVRSGSSGYMTNSPSTPSGEGHEYDIATRNLTVAASDHRNPNTTFIVLNSPYGIPETEVSVQLLHCASETADISTCRTINFANVQPIIDSTGRANDLFRRVEARVELVDTYFPIANFALAADDDGSDDDNIKKDFYVTKGCSYTESYPTASGVTYTGSTTCKDAGDRSESVAPSMNP